MPTRAKSAAPKRLAAPKPLRAKPPAKAKASREPKTKPTGASVVDFLNAVEHPTRRADAFAVDALMREASGEEPRMWGPSIVGYGAYDSPTGPWPVVGFSPRKTELVLYIMAGFAAYAALLAQLGKHRTGKSCLYVRKLADVEIPVLRELVVCAVHETHARHARPTP